MKKNSVIEYYLYLIAKAVPTIIRFIPIGFSIFIGKTIGALAFYFFKKKRNVAYKNLKIAFPYYSCKEINRIIKQTFMNCAQHIMEIFYLPWMDEKYIDKFIEFEGLDTILKIVENKKGVIFLGLHEGSWEVANIVLSQIWEKHNYAILARTQGDIPLLNQLLNQYRTKRDCSIITITDNLRPLIEHLKNGFALAMVADHGAHGGIFVDFFGKPTLTPTGAIKLALKLDTNLVIVFIERKGMAHHKISFAPYKLIRTMNTDKDLKINLENINRKFEEYIRNNPGEYLWFFKRWKYTPQRNVLVLSDGKLGHLKQSLAVLDLMKSLPFHIKSNIIEIKFKNKGQRIVFQICSFFFSSKCQGCMRCLRVLFGSEEANKLLSNSYDAVISCGSSLPMINRLIAFENTAKSIVIMRPDMFSLKRFDLAIIPEHDNVPKFNNVVLIKGALSRETDKNKEYIKAIIDDYGLENPLLSHPTIGVLLGGESRYFSLDTETVEKIINSLDEIVEKLGGSVLISTSRRTIKDVEQLLKEKLSTRPGYRMLIIANEFNPQGSFDTILHLSDILVVTCDSISMISESINSKKYTIVFKLRRKNLNFISKHERFIENLEKDGYIYVCRNNLSNKIRDIWRQKPPIKELIDQKIILQKLEKIL